MKINLGDKPHGNLIDFGTNYTNALNEVEDGECEEIYAISILDYIPHYDIDSFLDSLVKKMRHGCTLTIGGQDLIESTKQLLRGDHSTYAMNKILYGDKNLSHKGQYTLQFITDKLLGYGLNVKRKNLEYNNMFIEVTRP